MIRSIFFAPANRHDLLAKFPRFQADCYAIDLEDGTPPVDKASARGKLAEPVDALRAEKLSGKLYVRVNEAASEHFFRDLEAAVQCDIDGIILPKLERAEQIFPILHYIEQAEKAAPGKRRIEIMGGIESIQGVINVVALCALHERITSVYFGAEDFASDMGARRTYAGDEVLYARSQVVIGAKAARIIALDQAVIAIRDDEQCRRDAGKGRDMGYDGKICVHPRQVEICNEIYAPTEGEIEHALGVVQVYHEAMARGIGTIDYKGQMIDGPLLKRAEAVLAMAEKLKAQKQAAGT